MRSIVLFLLLSSQSPVVTLTVTPKVIFAGEAIHLICRVEKSPENRSVQYGIEGYTSSARQLDETSPSTFDQWYEHVPCEATVVFCQAQNSSGKITLRTQDIQVAGCDPNH